MANLRRRKVAAAITARVADAATARDTAKVTTSAAMAKDMVKVMSAIATRKVETTSVTVMTKVTSVTATRINHDFEVFSSHDLFLTKECTGVLD